MANADPGKICPNNLDWGAGGDVLHTSALGFRPGLFPAITPLQYAEAKLLQLTEQHTQTVTLEVPQGCPELTLELTDGSQLHVAVPEGLWPGDYFDVTLEGQMSDVDEAYSRRLTTFVALLRSYPKQLELCRARQRLAFVRGSLRDSTTVHAISRLPWDILASLLQSMLQPTYAIAIAAAVTPTKSTEAAVAAAESEPEVEPDPAPDPPPAAECMEPEPQED
jgi:hypothetical protein